MKKIVITTLLLLFFSLIIISLAVSIAISYLSSNNNEVIENSEDLPKEFELTGVINADGTIDWEMIVQNKKITKIKGRKIGNKINGKLDKYKNIEMEIPPSPASTKMQSFMAYTSVTAKNSNQYKVLNSPGAVDEGIYRKKNGKYFVALGSYYSTAMGDEFILKFEQSDGSIKKIKAILGDQKSDAHTDSKHQYHKEDKSIVEFITAKGTNKNGMVSKTATQINQDFGNLISIQKSEKIKLNFTGKIKEQEVSVEGKYNGEPLSGSGQIEGSIIKITGFIGMGIGKELGGYINPIRSGYTITSGYAERRNIKLPNGSYLTDVHTGIDLACPEGTPIYATKGGKVISAGFNQYGGNTTIIDHGNGVHSMYCHQSKISVRQGTTVRQGQIIGSVGATGAWCTGSHLHFEFRLNGKHTDPHRFVKNL